MKIWIQTALIMVTVIAVGGFIHYSLDVRIDRLERRVTLIELANDNTDNRVCRVERRLFGAAFFGCAIGDTE